MLRELLIFGSIVLYIETILQVYLVFSTVTPPLIRIVSLALIFGSHFVSNMASLILLIKNRTIEPWTNRVQCCVLHIMHLGLVWRLANDSNSYSSTHAIRLINCTLQTFPFLVIYGSLYLSHGAFGVDSIISLTTLLTSCFSASLIITSFSIRFSISDLNESDKVSIPRRLSGILLVNFGTLFMLASRIGTIVLMGSVETNWIIVPVGFHFLLLVILYMTCSGDLTCQTTSCSIKTVIRAIFSAYFNIFDLIESNLKVIQCKYVAFYALFLVENTVMAAVWLLLSEQEYVAKLLTVVFLIVLFVSALILKYTGFCFLSYGSTSLYDSTTKQPLSYAGDTLQSSCRTDVFIHENSTNATLASVDSHITDTIFSRQTTDSNNHLVQSLNTLETTAEITSPLPKTKSKKEMKRLKKGLLFRQSLALFPCPRTSTLKSSTSYPNNACNPAVIDSEVTGNILRQFRSSGERVKGRQNFKLGVHRSQTEIVNLQDETIPKKDSNPQRSHVKLHRTQSLHAHQIMNFRDFQNLDARRLSSISAWRESLDYPHSYLTTSDENNVNIIGDSVSSKTQSESSITNLTFSSNSTEWNISRRPQFINLHSLPTKKVDNQRRIRNWLSDTVSRLDLAYCMSDENPRDQLFCEPRLDSHRRLRHNTSTGCEKYNHDLSDISAKDKQLLSDPDLYDRMTSLNNTSEENSDGHNTKVFTITSDAPPLYENVHLPIPCVNNTNIFSGMHVNSLERIDQLKQYIINKDADRVDHINNGDNTVKRNLLRNIIDKNIPYTKPNLGSTAQHSDGVASNCVQQTRSIYPEDRQQFANYIIRKSISCPMPKEESQNGSRDNTKHKIAMPIESLV